MSDNGNKLGTLSSNATVDILQRKVTLKKELIHLRKLKINENKQIKLQNQIEEYENLLKQHRLKKWVQWNRRAVDRVDWRPSARNKLEKHSHITNRVNCY